MGKDKKSRITTQMRYLYWYLQISTRVFGYVYRNCVLSDFPKMLLIEHIEIKSVLLTLIKSITTMHIKPNNASPGRKLCLSLYMDTVISSNVDPAELTPIISVICDATIRIETADVNPEFTGPEMKSIKKPKTTTVNGITLHRMNSQSRGFFGARLIFPTVFLHT